MYVVLTDGQTIHQSRTVVDQSEFDRLNNEANRATDGNFRWELGNQENAQLPKSEGFRHVKRQETAEYECRPVYRGA